MAILEGEDYFRKQFFQPEVENPIIGADMWGFPVRIDDEVFIYQGQYLLIKEMNKSNIKMAELMRLKRDIVK